MSAAGFGVPTEQAAAQTTELPPIVVQGATLDAPPVKKKTKSAGGPSSTGAEAGEAGPQASAEGDGATEGIPQDQLGSAITVVTGKQLREQQIRNAADALRSLPGVYVNRNAGTPASLTQVRIRGAEGNHTLVLIDGIEANDTTNGEFNFSDLSAEDIEQIEVIRGPQSGIYGSGAVGGVINIITRGGKGPLRASAYGEGGSFGTFNRGVRISGGTDKIWGSAAIERLEADGFNIAPVGSEKDGWDLTTYSIRAGAQIMPGLTLDLTLRSTDKHGDRDTQAPFPDPSGVQVDDPATFNESTWLGGLKLTWDTMGGALTNVVKATRNETKRSDFPNQGPPSMTDSVGERTTYSYLPTYRFNTPALWGARHSVTGLVEYDRETFTSNSFSTDPGFPFPADGVEHERSRTSFAAEHFVEFANRLSVTSNVRHDDNDTLGDFTTWRVASSLQLTEYRMRPHASVGTAVKFPTMFELFGSIPGFFTPNPNLVPEESFGWDAGVEFSVIANKFVIDVTYFEADLENKISGFFTPVNALGTSQRDGVEVAARWQVMRDLSLGAAYTYLTAYDPNGVEEIRRPRHTGRADVNYRFDGGRGNVNVSAVYNGDMTDTNFGPFPATTVVLGDYWLVDVAASYKLMPGVEMYGRVNNLLDQDYQEVYGFETAGIAAFAGLRFTYDEPSTRAWAAGK